MRSKRETWRKASRTIFLANRQRGGRVRSPGMAGANVACGVARASGAR
jgi:hypothetical protein